MDIKRYKLEYADEFEVNVEIDHSILTEEKLHEINNFWGNSEDRLFGCTVLDAVLKMFCVTLLQASVEHMDPERQFNEGKIEGWPPVDGSYGLKLLSCDLFSFDSDRVDIYPA